MKGAFKRKKEKEGSSKKERKKDKDEKKKDGSSKKKEVTEATPQLEKEGTSGDFSGAIEQTPVFQDEDGLIFTGDVVDGKPVIKGGTIQKLVERLTYEKDTDQKFVKAFMLTFRSFTTPAELLQLLKNRFNLNPPTGVSQEEFDATLKVIRLKVFNVLKLWLNNGYSDFHSDSQLKNTLLEFINREMKPVGMENPANTLLKLNEKKEAAAGDKEYEIVFSEPPPPPILPQNVTANNKSNILTYSAKELARQLTLIEYRLFAAINPSECVSQHWMSKNKEALAPNILKMISRFNDVSNWVASEIVKCTDLATRTQILKHVIEIAEECFAINNFNGVMEIVSGLHSSSVFRLKATWAGLPKKCISSFEEMHETMSRDFSYKNIRAVLRNVNPPCIPYLGMYLTDLTFIEEGNPNTLPDGSINFIKRQRLSEVISDIQTYQNTPYCLMPVEYIKEYLMNAEALPEEQCYKLSQKRESRRGTAAVDEQTPDLPFGDLEVKSTYLFDKKDEDSAIIFEKKDIQDGVVPVIAATLVKLIERLTYHETNQDMNFLSAFLMTYPTFTTGDEILNLLDNRFNMPKPANPSKQQMQKFTSSRLFPIHLRIINLLKSWVTTYPEDFVNNDALQSKFNTLITSWAEKSSKLQSTFDSVKKVFEKKIVEPLPTPECRFIGFLHGEEEPEEQQAYYKDKTLLDFDDDTIAQQISLIEQNFFSSIKQREFLCDTWEDEEMEAKAPNILAMRQNLELLRRWTCTQVLNQSSWHRQYSALTVLVFVAEKLLGNKNFSSAMGITSGLVYLKQEFPQLWEWVPSVAIEKYKELELLLKSPKRLRLLEKNEEAVSTIPFIELYINQLKGFANTIADVTGPGGSLINFEKRRKQWSVFRTIEEYQGRPYAYEYDGPCGGFLYHSDIWPIENVPGKIRSIQHPPPPDCRPELIDIQRVTKNSAQASEDGISGYQDDDQDTDGAVTATENPEVLSSMKTYLSEIIKTDKNIFTDLINEAKAKLASDLMEELKQYSERVRDEISVMQTQLGINQGGISAAQRIVARVFQGVVLPIKEIDSDGQVYGWQDEVCIFKVTDNENTWLVHVTTHLDKSDISSALRLFRFFSDLSNDDYKNAIIATEATQDAQTILASRGVRVFSYAGVELC